MQKIGRYEILAELGRGAMGVVYSAMDPLIGRRVAIKTIRLDSVEAAENREELTRRLFREAQSAGVLSHPGIITIHDVGEQGNEAFIVMEYVDGRNLEDVLASGVPQHSGTLLSILRQCATALDYAHGKGIIHRDIKPSNIMLCHDGIAKIADFGVAKLAASTSMTQAGLVLGTPSYMSPEQAQGNSLDGRSDQFSLAVVAYRMLTGELPFQGATLTALLTKILLEDPRYDSSGLHPYLQIVFKRALAKIPQFRFPNCTDFVRDLEGAYSLCKAEMAGGKPASVIPETKPAAAKVEVPPTATLAEGNPLPSVLSPASDQSLLPQKRRTKVMAWIAVLAVIVLAAIAFLAIKTVQKQKSPGEVTYSNVVDATRARPTQGNISGAAESKTAMEMPSQEKPEAAKNDSPGTGPSDSVHALPDAATTSNPTSPATAHISRKFESGTVTWTGKLGKNAILVLTPPQASMGSITGEFPGKPISIEVEPKEVIIRQAPAQANGYKLLMLHSGPNKFTSITVRWKTIP